MKLLHTVMARVPDEPSADESEALRAYIHLFQRLYPCGECASHFREILDKFPPQVSSRSTAAAWACHAHNEVNKSLKKDIFDCSNIGDFYDCGCAADEAKEKEEKKEENAKVGARAESIETPDTHLARTKEGLGFDEKYLTADLLPKVQEEG